MENDTTDISSQDKKHMILFTLFAVVIIVVLIICAIISPDARPKIIRNELQQRGYHVSCIDFEFIENGDTSLQWIYQSSEPVYYDGEYYTQWKLTKWTFLLHFYNYSVEPYSDPLPFRYIKCKHAGAFTTHTVFGNIN
jgi:hypothetical protein